MFIFEFLVVAQASLAAQLSCMAWLEVEQPKPGCWDTGDRCSTFLFIERSSSGAR
jgi:hypothetical protein